MKAGSVKLSGKKENLLGVSVTENVRLKMGDVSFKDLLKKVVGSTSDKKGINVCDLKGKSAKGSIGIEKGIARKVSSFLSSKNNSKLEGKLAIKNTDLESDLLNGDGACGEVTVNCLNNMVNKPVNILKDKKLDDFVGLQVSQQLKGSREFLVRTQGRDLLLQVQDFRSKNSHAKTGGALLDRSKKIDFFDREGRIQSPFLKIPSPLSVSGESYPFLACEDSSLSFPSLMNDLKKHELVNDVQFWEEWEAKVESQLADKAKIILKENEKGEIYLRLHPNKLGNVKVSLELEGSQAFVRVVVDNWQVKQLFELSQFALQKSLEELGLQVSLGFSTSQDTSYDESRFSDSSHQAYRGAQGEDFLIEALDVAFSQKAESLIDLVV